MHQPVKDRLEEYLRRTGSSGFEEIEAHLSACQDCRRAVSAMERQSQMLRSAFHVREEVEPGAGFYARVVQQIETQGRPSLWSLLLDPQFGRRLVYSTVALLLLLSTYMVTTEPGEDEQVVTTATEKLVVESDAVALGANRDKDRDTVLVHLSSFSE
jgi:anti-sigma factor RsiW